MSEMENPKQIVEEREKEALEALKKENSVQGLTEWKNSFLSKKSPLMQLMSLMRQIPNELKAAYGKLVNDARNAVEKAFEEKMKKAQEEALKEKLEAERIDLTLPGRSYSQGSINPYWEIVDEMSDIFASMGFDIVEGRDVETDHFNFELLNVPKDHPARDMQDTFYLSDSLLLRTQTSAAQAHTMLENEEKKPIKMICPGKCYRRDDDDATHSHEFGQIEGLVVDKGISLADLKGTLELFVKKMFGEKRQIRLRSSFFPFTEPSVEVDVSCSKCGGKGCSLCKGTGWIEILGAGEVHPHVLEMCGYDPKIYSGFAFGVGVERIAMLRYGIDDIRRIYTNDVRFLKDFTEK
jgi:phenylalanyl-tRNA synthetase alpha chain